MKSFSANTSRTEERFTRKELALVKTLLISRADTILFFSISYKIVGKTKFDRQNCSRLSLFCGLKKKQLCRKYKNVGNERLSYKFVGKITVIYQKYQRHIKVNSYKDFVYQGINAYGTHLALALKKIKNLVSVTFQT